MELQEDKSKKAPKKAKGPNGVSRTKYFAIAPVRIATNKQKKRARHALRVERQTFKVINVARGTQRAALRAGLVPKGMRDAMGFKGTWQGYAKWRYEQTVKNSTKE